MRFSLREITLNCVTISLGEILMLGRMDGLKIIGESIARWEPSKRTIKWGCIVPLALCYLGFMSALSKPTVEETWRLVSKALNSNTNPTATITSRPTETPRPIPTFTPTPLPPCPTPAPVEIFRDTTKCVEPRKPLSKDAPKPKSKYDDAICPPCAKLWDDIFTPKTPIKKK